MSEDRLLAECHKWLWNTHPETRRCSWHVANERKITPMQGAILRAKGVLSGVPDYVFNWNGKTYYFEMKTATGRLSPTQKKVISSLQKQNFNVVIIRTFEEFKSEIEKILK